jgi:voltage-gated potassium channel
LSLLSALLGLGTLGYRLQGWTLLEGFYMTLITVSTVGFSEVHPMTTTSRLFTSGLILTGVVLLGFTTASLVETVVEGRLTERLGRRRMQRQIAKLKDHWIICGYGRIGQQVISELAADKRELGFVVLELDPERCQLCEQRGHIYLQEDATHEQTLEMAGIERARGLVSLVASDAENVFICLTARAMQPELQIIARCLEDRSEAKLRRAGANKVFAPYQIGGLQISQSILRPSVANFIEFTTHRQFQGLELEEVEIQETSSLVGQSLKQSPIRSEFNLIVLAIHPRGGSMRFNPGPDIPMAAGDTLIVMGEGEQLHLLEKHAAG